MHASTTSSTGMEALTLFLMTWMLTQRHVHREEYIRLHILDAVAVAAAESRNKTQKTKKAWGSRVE